MRHRNRGSFHGCRLTFATSDHILSKPTHRRRRRMRNVGTLILIATAIAARPAMAQERPLPGPASRQADDTATVLRRVEIPNDGLALYESLAPLSIVLQREVLTGVLH